MEKTDIAVTPLGIPMLAGPGAISTVIVLQNQAKGLPQYLALYGCIVGVSVVSYFVLRISARGAKWISPIAMSIAIRVMGLLLAAVAIQFMINALLSLHAEWLAVPVK
jgi:multiple antibiotic resistance protein